MSDTVVEEIETTGIILKSLSRESKSQGLASGLKENTKAAEAVLMKEGRSAVVQ